MAICHVILERIPSLLQKEYDCQFRKSWIADALQIYLLDSNILLKACLLHMIDALLGGACISKLIF